MSSHVALKTLWILISWLLKKPADLDLHCLRESSGFILFSKEKIVFAQNGIRVAQICSFGQVKFSMDKYIMALYLS